MDQQNNKDLSPTKEILAFAVKELTKDWTPEQQEDFSKNCFNVVTTDRYRRLKKSPVMKLQLTRQ